MRTRSPAGIADSHCSHRPYRPAPGVDKALAEIARGRATLYDAAAVDACLELFHSGEFAFERTA